MEGKDTDPVKDIYENLLENVHREVEEEAKITDLRSLHHTGLVFQNREKDYPANTYFQYHVFQAFVTKTAIDEAQDEFAWIAEHPLAFARFKKDKREKDALAWFNPIHTKMMGRWSPSIVAMYLSKFGR
jgi:ADP-ribose pyrophosphatase YjhB (NUDIX family)